MANMASRTGQIQRGVQTVLGQISRLFAQTPEYKLNKKWNNEINVDPGSNLHFYFQNPHGISRDSVQTGQDLMELQERHVGIFGFAETNLAWNKPYVMTEYLQAQQKVWQEDGGAKSCMSSIDLALTGDYRTGGTVTTAVGQWCSRVLTTEADPSGMGRWSSITLLGKRNTQLTFITGYRCVRPGKGDASAWAQEKVNIRAKTSKKDPNPQRQFVDDMIRFINDKRSKGHEVQLALDANELLGAESNGVVKILHECGMWDLLDIPGGSADSQLQDTFVRGKNRRIDHIFGTRLFLGKGEMWST